MANVSRTVNKFSNLYYMVKVKKPTGQWNNIPNATPATTDVFRICTISNTSYYGTAPDEVNAVDWNLDIGTIDNSFGGLISQNPLAKIPQIRFSIDNLTLIYHQLCEANGGDLNAFMGAELTVYLCNGLVPGMFWNSGAGQWRDENGTAYVNQIPAPGGTYPDNDFAYRVFTGTISNIGFSAARTDFNALGVADKINTQFGTLAGVNSDFKTRGDIIPITYGNWASEGDLAPLILERDSSDVPRVFLDTEPLTRLDNIRLYDKVSELDYRVENQKDVNLDNNTVTFQNDSSSAQLEANITDDPTDWNNGSELGNVLRSHFPANNQLLFNVNGEVVAFQHDFNRFPSNPNYTTNRSASRGWSGGEVIPHSSSEELFEIDANIQKANAVITIPLQLSELYLNTIQAANSWVGTGSLQLTLENTDSTDQDTTHQNYYWRVGLKKTAGGSGQGADADFLLKYKEFGFTGDVLNYDIDLSVLGERFNDSFVVQNTLNVRKEDDTLLFAINLNDVSNPYDFEETTNDITASFPTTDDLKQGLKLEFSINAEGQDYDEIPTNIQLNYINAECRIRVYAENGLWYWRGLGRIDGDLIENPSDVVSNLLSTELDFTNFASFSTNRQDWKTAPSIYGKEPSWRSWIKDYCLNTATAQYQAFNGFEIQFDLEKNDIPDYTINENQIELNTDLQEIDYTFTDRMDLYNEFIIKFRHNPANGKFLNILKINENEIESTDELQFFTGDAPNLRSRCGDASTSLGLNNGEKKQFIFEAKSIRNQRTAEQLLQHFVRWHTSTKTIVKVNTILPETYNWDLGQQVVFGNVQGLPQKVLDAQYIITGKAINPNIKGSGPKITFTLTEVIA